MSTLAPALRKLLETAVRKARCTAETAASAALGQLAVAAPEPFAHLSEDDRALRNALRARARQLGDVRDADTGEHKIERLVEECAYEHWHRMLFARFLAENGMLIANSEALGLVDTPVTLEECEELATAEQARGGWELAARYASRMLPQVFRVDAPALHVVLPAEYQQDLEKLLAALPVEVFTASDSLGWVYQFWQADLKKEIDDAELKVGARELPAVTQLFTESYMVSFLLDNSLGVWWAAQQLTDDELRSSESEEELRQKAAIPGVPLEYLRFVRTESGPWEFAAGTFERWPNTLQEFKVIDPSCGSGHFLVAVLLMLVPLRMSLEGFSAREAVDAVLRENLHGLDIDKRVTEIAAFAVALAAWTYPNAGGYRLLPEIQIACPGVSVSVSKEEWRELGLGGQSLKVALDWMHGVFQDAPTLGSLINPAKSDAAKLVQWNELQIALDKALTHGENEVERETAIAAQGLAKATALLSMRYHLVATNVPYLARGKQDDTLRTFSEKHYNDSKNDLATAFLDRCLEFTNDSGIVSAVLPQNWLFLTGYRAFRKRLLKNHTWKLLIRLGEGGFESSAAAGAFTVLLTIGSGKLLISNDLLFDATPSEHHLRGMDVSAPRTATEKASLLKDAEMISVNQARQLANPDARVILDGRVEPEQSDSLPLLSKYSGGLVGLQTGDDFAFTADFWEVGCRDAAVWEWMQLTPSDSGMYAGHSGMVRWEQGDGRLLSSSQARPQQGEKAVGRGAVVIHRMRTLVPFAYSRMRFHQNVAVILPVDAAHLPAIWCFCLSSDYNEAVRRLDQKLNVTNGTLTKVPFDLVYWQGVAEERYPSGLPQPYTDDPTQWIFHGHPCGSVVWDEEEKWTVDGPLRVDENVLQIAVARLLGYRWPAELDPEMELSAEQRRWVERCEALLPYADTDGIVCLPSVRGEARADQRVDELLAAAYGEAWSPQVRAVLLNAAGTKGKGLDWWLQEEFFKQHCKLFGNRPFVWHIWDGVKVGGFSALVNYHKLDHKLLQTLIYTYLGDWIRRQEAEQQEGVDGAGERLAAALSLKTRLEAILKGEAPYDIFVRWKLLHEQAIGWNPDINDGVRMNIRPFMEAPDVGAKGAGVLRAKPNIKWAKDRGSDIPTAPWYHLGPSYGEKEGARINEHHLSLAEKGAAREKVSDS